MKAKNESELRHQQTILRLKTSIATIEKELNELSQEQIESSGESNTFKMGRKNLHNHLLKKIIEIVGEKDYENFKSVIEVFNLGLEDSSHYNRAIRGLCASNHPKVSLLLKELLPQRLKLGISLLEINNEGLSALDYAAKNNVEACKLIQDCFYEEGFVRGKNYYQVSQFFGPINKRNCYDTLINQSVDLVLLHMTSEMRSIGEKIGEAVGFGLDCQIKMLRQLCELCIKLKDGDNLREHDQGSRFEVFSNK